MCYITCIYRCKLPVCNKKCEEGDLHKLECNVFSAVVDYHNNLNAQSHQGHTACENNNEARISKEEMEQLVNTFTVSKFDSNCPVYACITPLRLLLKCRQEMAHETLKLQKGSISKDEVDVSGHILKCVHMHILILRIIVYYLTIILLNLIL